MFVCLCVLGVCMHLEALDYAVGLEGRHYQIEDPEWEEEYGSDKLRGAGTTELAADRLDRPPHHQHDYHHASLRAE